MTFINRWDPFLTSMYLPGCYKIDERDCCLMTSKLYQQYVVYNAKLLICLFQAQLSQWSGISVKCASQCHVGVKINLCPQVLWSSPPISLKFLVNSISLTEFHKQNWEEANKFTISKLKRTDSYQFRWLFTFFESTWHLVGLVLNFVQL